MKGKKKTKTTNSFLQVILNKSYSINFQLQHAYCIFAYLTRYMEKLKKRWGLTSNWQVLTILLVFSITGYSSLLIAKPILGLFGLQQETANPWIYRPLRILLIFPFYQVLIVLYGWLFGQFQFFWAFEKKMLSRIGFKRFFKEAKK